MKLQSIFLSPVSLPVCGPSGRLEDSVRLYHEALSLAQQAGDQEAVEKMQEGLKEVKKRKEQERKEEQQEAAEE